MTSRRTTWERLHHIADKRRQHLGLSQIEVQELHPDAPSPAAFRKIKERQGPATVKMRPLLSGLDAALGWPDGTSWRLASDSPFKEGSIECSDEEDRLVKGDETTWIPTLRNRDVIDTFETIVLPKLRRMDHASAERAMEQISRMLGVG